jgi:sugar lactone lactonase YvrE
MMQNHRTILDGLWFGEGPRWHDGALFFSDMHGHRVVRTDLEGRSSTVVELAHDEPSGLGWLPDGRLLVVAMETQKLHRLEADGTLVEHADLSGIAQGDINDMIVAADGTAYVGDMGARIHDPQSPRVPGQTIRVTPDGAVSCGAGDLSSPNGHILTADGRTLIVAESGAGRLTAFDVADDGTLSNRRVYAALTPPEGSRIPLSPPDGVCLDAAGAVWVADPVNARLFRVLPGGEVTDAHTYTGAIPIACVLGGPDRRTLLVCVAGDWRRDEVKKTPTGRIDAFDVDIPGAGRP